MSKETRTTSSTGGQKGTKLERFDLIPIGPLTSLARHYGVGASKYANHQWRQGYEWSKSYAALMRHLTAFWNGQDYDVCSNDPEGCRHTDLDGEVFVAVNEDACFNHTGSHHMAAVAWHSFCLLEFIENFPQHDDRYKPEPVEAEKPILPPGMWVLPEQPVEMFDLDDAGDAVQAMARLLGDSGMAITDIKVEWKDPAKLTREQIGIQDMINRMLNRV